MYYNTAIIAIVFLPLLRYHVVEINPSCRRNSVRDIRIGLYSAGLRTYWAQFPGLKARLESYNRFIAEKLSAYGEVYNFGLLDNADRSEEAADYFGENRVDLLFLHSATYFTSDMVLPVHRTC